MKVLVLILNEEEERQPRIDKCCSCIGLIVEPKISSAEFYRIIGYYLVIQAN